MCMLYSPIFKREDPSSIFSIIVRVMKNRHRDVILVREAVRFILTETVIDDDRVIDEQEDKEIKEVHKALKEFFSGKPAAHS